jgi:hypothetical protein
MQLTHEYKGKIVCLNLLNHFGHEELLGKIYRNALRLLTSEEQRALGHSIVLFDYDLNTGGTKVLASILKTIEECLTDQSCTVGELKSPARSTSSDSQTLFTSASLISSNSALSSSSTVKTQRKKEPASGIWLSRKQRGCFRVNCLDCLDRTNMIEFLIGCKALPEMLKALGVLDQQLIAETCPPNGENDCMQLRFMLGGEEAMEQFRRIWCENGDQLANLCKS